MITSVGYVNEKIHCAPKPQFVREARIDTSQEEAASGIQTSYLIVRSFRWHTKKEE
jgi:hypothetical protein